MRTIRESVKKLEAFQNLGRPVEGMPMDYREWIVQFGNAAYLVFYRYHADRVSILDVRHSREEDYPPHD